MTKNDIYPPDEQKRAGVLDFLGNRFQRSLHTSVLGKSILSRSIDLYRIGFGKTNVLFVGAHHGSEYITASVLYSFLLKFLERDERYGKYCGIDTRIYKELYSVYVIPALNPDGIEISLYGITENPLEERQRRMIAGGDHRLWQANARGVDLNHNYAMGFGEYKVIERERGIEPGATLYSGEFPESEPETRAILGLLRAVDFSLVVSLHTQGEEIYAYPKNNGRVRSISARLSSRLGYTLSEPLGTAAYGGLSDYTAGVMGIPSFTLELGTGVNPISDDNLGKITAKTDSTLFLIPTWL